jgi:hypothetical protein
MACYGDSFTFYFTDVSYKCMSFITQNRYIFVRLLTRHKKALNWVMKMVRSKMLHVKQSVLLYLNHLWDIIVVAVIIIHTVTWSATLVDNHYIKFRTHHRNQKDHSQVIIQHTELFNSMVSYSSFDDVFLCKLDCIWHICIKHQWRKNVKNGSKVLIPLSNAWCLQVIYLCVALV